MTYLSFGTCLWIVLIGAGMIANPRRRLRRLLAIGLAGLLFWSLPAATAALSVILERRYSRSAMPGGAGAIVVLAAGLRTGEVTGEALPDPDTYSRCRYAAWLYHNWKALPVLVTGGPSFSAQKPLILADVMAQVLEQAGVPRAMIWTETASRSTYENAVYSAVILRPKAIRRVALVTDATHMVRSEACFRKQGLEVVAAPSGRRGDAFQPDIWTSYIPTPRAMLDNEEVLHEWAGLAWYRLLGRI